MFHFESFCRYVPGNDFDWSAKDRALKIDADAILHEEADDVPKLRAQPNSPAWTWPNPMSFKVVFIALI